MSTQPLVQAIASTRAVLANVRADQMDGATPCSSWKVSDLVNHIFDAQGFFISGVTGQPPAPADRSAGDLSAYDAATADAVAAFSGEGVMGKMLTLPFGQMPGAAFAGLAATDVFTHGWDLAKATGQSTDLAPDLAAALLAGAKQAISPAFRGPEGAPFGTEQEAPAGSTNADKLAAFLGRTV